MTRENRQALGKLGRQHVENNYSFKNYERRWVEIMTDIHEHFGSWENRRNYQSWEVTEV